MHLSYNEDENEQKRHLTADKETIVAPGSTMASCVIQVVDKSSRLVTVTPFVTEASFQLFKPVVLRRLQVSVWHTVGEWFSRI